MPPVYRQRETTVLHVWMDLPQQTHRDPSSDPVLDDNQDPAWRPGQTPRRKHGRGVIKKQNQLKHGRLQLSLVAIRNVSSKIAEEVDIEDVVFVLARVCPPTEDKVLCG